MEKRIYLGEFSGWGDVVSNYGGACPTIEPGFVLATYDTGNWEGHSSVITSDDGVTFEVVEGSHCSCFGLEGQWEPTSHTIPEMRKMMGASYGFFDDHRADLSNWLERFEPAEKMAA